MFDFLRKKSNKDEIVFTFVIESGKVLSAIISHTPGKKPEILYTHKESITYQQDVNPERLENLMLESVKMSGDVLAREGYKNISQGSRRRKIAVFLGSPWYAPIRGVAKVTKDKPFLIKEKMIEDTVRENFSLSHKDAVIIEQKIITVRGNGYRLDNPIGKKASALDIEFISNASSKKIISDIEEMIHVTLPVLPITFHTTISSIFPSALAAINKKNFLLFLPEHEISDIVLAREGNFVANISIPYGKHAPVRAIAAAFHTSKEEAHSLLMLYLSKKLETEKMEQIDELLKLIKAKFQEVLRESLWKLSTTVFLPSDIVVADAHPISKLLGLWIQTEEFSEKTLTSKNFAVHFLENNDVEKAVTVPLGVTYRNPLLLSTALYNQSL